MKISFKQEWYENALNEQKERSKYMITKFADNEKRKAGQIRGLVIEHHISGYMQKTYPANYLNADNYQIWTKPCNHDFKLKNTTLGTILVDVTGPKADLTFGSYSQKPSGCDFHIIAKPIYLKSWNNVDFTQGFEILGVITGNDYTEILDWNKVITFENWIQKLNL